MKLNTYSKALASCLSSANKLDCAYILYTKDTIPEINDTIDSANIINICDSTKGVVRSTSVVAMSTNSDSIDILISSRQAAMVGAGTLEFSAGVKIYGVILSTSSYRRTGTVYPDDIFLSYHKLEEPITLPAGSDLGVTVTLNLGGN
jgi:hypothetical protein